MQRLSVVIPIYNEVDNIPHLVPAVTEVLQKTGLDYEVICVDDGSRDGSTERLRHLARERHDLKVVVLRRNYGQTAALAAGFDQATGDVVITLDGDLQNDPHDIPRLLAKLAEGYDLVCGWRQHRQDDGLTRLLPSRVANWLIGQVTGVKLHDYGCTLKAYRRELLRDMHLYGELHRFLPALADMEGARIAEIPVQHHPRRFGRSKYGLGRTLRVLMDLLTIAFMKTFLTRPMHVFGLVGLVFLLLGLGLGTYLAVLKWVWGQSIGQRPLLFLAGLAVTSGLQLFCFGLLAELLMRTYHESQGRPIYRIREVVAGRPHALVD
ncbi:MAG: glycosyltransferase family 2 protein [Gloeomargarita sp. SKYG116]|nr:glycosyltransferase family 2 protein [Gloeomargarita sp. SKYG116]MCS7225387.1 glycosyltransferase family 2 protein [Gloeomargarita sp. SKYB31]MDW8401651.1 glycosyltransferase family 2 protein [Gloeomargarita sp. SKYGB_i_bin116]